MMAEKMLSVLNTKTETELRNMRNEFSMLEANHIFESETTRETVRLLVDVIGTLIFRT